MMQSYKISTNTFSSSSPIEHPHFGQQSVRNAERKLNHIKKYFRFGNNAANVLCMVKLIAMRFSLNIMEFPNEDWECKGLYLHAQKWGYRKH